MSWNKRVLAGLWGILRPLDFFEKVDLEVEWQKKIFRINMIGVVLTMFPVFFRIKKFFLPRPLPWSARTQNFFFSQKPLKTRFEHFSGGFIWFCVLEKKNIFFDRRSVLGRVSPRPKIFFIFLDDLSSQNAKFECFSGFWFLIFCQPWLAVRVSSGDPNSKIKISK